MKTIILVFLLSVMAFGQSGKSNLTQQQKDSINAMIASAVSADSLGYVTPQTFGAVADGVTDDYTALSAAIDFAKLNKIKLFLPTGTYKINSEITKTILDGEYLEIEGQNAILDGSSLGVSDVLLSIVGDNSTGAFSLSSPASIGDTTLSMDTTGIDVGDILVIRTSATWYYDTKQGEIKRVKSKEGGVITIEGVLYDNYPTAITTVRPIKSSGVKISGVKFKHNNTNGGIYAGVSLSVTLAQNIVIEDCEFIENKGIHIILGNVFNARLNRLTMRDADQYGYGYGVEVCGSENTIITNSTIEGSRHAVTTSYGTPYQIPNRNLTVDKCFVSNSKGYNGALDTHAGSENSVFTNNVIFGGINIRDISCRIENNFIYPTHVQAISITETDTSSIRSRKYVIRNNTVQAIDTTKAYRGISYASNLINTVDEFIIEDNKFYCSNVGMQIYASAVTTIKNLTFRNNIVRMYDRDDNQALFITGSLRILDLRLENEDYSSNDNGLTASISSTDTIKFLSISDSRFKTNTAQSLYLGAGIDRATLNNNYFEQDAYNDIYVRDFVSLTNNHFAYKNYNIRSAVDTLYYSNNFLNPSWKSASTNSATITIAEDNITGVEGNLIKSVASVSVTGLTTAMINGKYIKIMGSGGAVDITSNPQIADGILDGQELWLIGTSNSNTVKIDDGDGIDLGDPSLSYTLGSGDILGLVWVDADDLWHRLPNTTLEAETGQLLLSVGVDTTILEPSRVLTSTSRIDSIGAMVRDSSVSWTLKTGTDWDGTLTNVFSSNKTTTTNTMTYYTDFDDYIAENSMFFLDVDSSAGTDKEALKVEVFYTNLTFHPMELSPVFYGYNTVEDANSKITEWTDRTSNNNDFLQSDTSKSPLLVGGELTFNGIDDYLTIGDDASFDFGTSDVSIECWVKTDTTTGTFLSKYIGTGDIGWWFGEQAGNGRLLFVVYHGDGNSSAIVTANSIADNLWHHVVVVLDRNVGAYLYVDGTLVISELTTEWTDQSALDVTSTNGCYIGRAGTINYFNGNISNLRFYTQALTPANISNLYNFGR